MPPSLLSYHELVQLVALGVVQNVDPSQINGTSIDITLARHILIEKPPEHEPRVVVLQERKPLAMTEVDLRDREFTIGGWDYRGYGVAPGEFVLASSQQVFDLPPDISAEYKLKSSMARIGLEHLNAGWCDPTWNGSALTLELFNSTRYHHQVIQEGNPIGQMVFFRNLPVPESKSYAQRGRYNGDTRVQAIKP